MFDIGESRTNEEARTRKFREYTLAFWDAHLSSDYDRESALTFLQQPPTVHEASPQVYDYQISMPTQVFWVRDKYDAPLVQFQDDGNILLLKGTLVSGSKVLYVPDGDLLIENAEGGLLGMVDTASGDLRISGSVTEFVPALTLGPDPELAIQNAEDAATDAKIIVDKNGNLKLIGGVYGNSQL